jgi:hypothetical protein
MSVGLIKMEELIKRLSGKKIDVSCGSGAMLRGEVIDVRDGVLYLRDEDDKSAYVAIDKIATVYECSDAATRPGFIG